MASVSIRTARPRPYWLLLIAACLVPALLNASTTYVNTRFSRGAADWSAVLFAATLWLTFGLLTPIPYVLARHHPIRSDRIAGTFVTHVFGALALCAAWSLMGVSLALLMNRRPPLETLPHYYAYWTLTNLPWAVFLYFTVLGSVYAFTYYHEARERESQQARLTAQLAEARLSALRMQLNPHFLFNSLNAITVLVRDQNTRDASRMLELLSGVLRQVLQSGKRQEVTLGDELHFTEQYLAIEQVRFSDRLEVRWDINPELRDVLVPEFILQPLVENAIRHGIAKRSSAGIIEIAAQAMDKDIVLRVHDNGPGYHPDSDSGVGLANTRARLATLFAEVGKLDVVNDERGGAIASVRFPLRKF
jgi:two-component system LytT family sensor kinase